MADTANLPEQPPGREPTAAPYLAGLNPEQRDAVAATEGPVLVLAGAGTGKTRVLTTRLAHLLHNRLARPHEILCVTFTNKAANEMKERVATLIGGAVEAMPWLGTFHSVAARMLRRHAELAGLKPDFSILDQDDQLRLIKQVIGAANIDDKSWPARHLAGLIESWKNRGLVPGKVPRGEAFAYADGKGADMYRAYQEILGAKNAVDFGDLLLHCLELFTGHAQVLGEYQERIKYILVDEYQDTNVAQYLWLRLLAQKRRNVCCVGDDDQSIYGWRGAEVGNILKFEADFPGARIVRLERNYRSTGHILGAASGLIAANAGRLGKTLWTEGSDGEKVAVHGYWDGPEEARAIAGQIDDLHRAGHALSEMAILVRASFQTREFEERFNLTGIPYRLIGGTRFYERREIRDAVAYLRVLARPGDDLAFERIVNTPKRGLGEVAQQTMFRLARANGGPLTAAAKSLAETDELRPQARNSLAALLSNLERWRGDAADMPLPERAVIVLDESGYTEMWRNDKSVEAPGRLENLGELVHALGEFENLEEFLDHVSLVVDRDQNPSDDMVNVMTLHGAKGLEFSTVFLPGWEEDLFPHHRSLDEGGDLALEEERRLAYVGLTRAKQRARVSYAASRQVFGQWLSSLPSRFVDELPGEHVERAAETGLYERRRPPGFGEPGAKRRRSGFEEEFSQLPPDFDLDAEPGFGPGDRVHHQKFGSGRIISVDGNKLVVQFKSSGRKKVMTSFVTPA